MLEWFRKPASTLNVHKVLPLLLLLMLLFVNCMNFMDSLSMLIKVCTCMDAILDLALVL